MGEPKWSEAYVTPDEEEEPDPLPESNEKAEVMKLHELLEERMASSKRTLNGVAKKGAALKRRLHRPDSVREMKAVLSQPPPEAAETP